MSQNTKGSDPDHLRWQAHRRGMLELDQVLGGFFDVHYVSLSPDMQASFRDLLAVSDQTLFN